LEEEELKSSPDQDQELEFDPQVVTAATADEEDYLSKQQEEIVDHLDT